MTHEHAMKLLGMIAGDVHYTLERKLIKYAHLELDSPALVEWSALAWVSKNADDGIALSSSHPDAETAVAMCVLKLLSMRLGVANAD
jgi:hypothetical protein